VALAVSQPTPSLSLRQTDVHASGGGLKSAIWFGLDVPSSGDARVGQIDAVCTSAYGPIQVPPTKGWFA
jgi:hypothetical protein